MRVVGTGGGGAAGDRRGHRMDRSLRLSGAIGVFFRLFVDGMPLTAAIHERGHRWGSSEAGKRAVGAL